MDYRHWILKPAYSIEDFAEVNKNQLLAASAFCRLATRALDLRGLHHLSIVPDKHIEEMLNKTAIFIVYDGIGDMVEEIQFKGHNADVHQEFVEIERKYGVVFSIWNQCATAVYMEKK